MASGPEVEEGDGTRPKQRFMEAKVYTRKSFKGLKKNVIAAISDTNAENAKPNAADAAAVTTDDAAAAVVTDKNDKGSSKDSDPPLPDSVKDGNLSPEKPSRETDVAVSKDEPSLNQQETAAVETPAPTSRPDAVVSADESRSLNPPEAAEVAVTASNPAPNSPLVASVPAVSPTLNQEKSVEALAPVPAPVSAPRVDVAISDDSSSLNRQPGAATEALAPAPTARLEVVVSDDSSSLSRRQASASVAPTPTSRGPPSGNGPEKQGTNNLVETGQDVQMKQEARQLRRKLRGQLETVRNLVKKIEVKQVQISGHAAHSHVSPNTAVNNGGAKRAHSEVGSVGVSRDSARPFNQLSISLLQNSQGGSDIVEKEKRTPKANQFYRNSEFLLAKDKFPPAESNKKSKSNGKKHGGDYGNGYGMGPKFTKSCSSLLDKLMKHKHGWVFNEPVDAEQLGLHDYHIIITQPMDLGTIKSRLSKNWYKSPKEFAEDVRLTFRNAMTYNPKGQDVHVMAEQLLMIFEERWAIIESDYNSERRFGMDYGGYPTPTSRKVPPLLPPPLDMRRVLDRSESMTYSYDPKRKPTSTTPSGGRTPALKKPKAKDLHKRDMTYEEKQKLSTNLQGLPPEKLDAIVQIIKKRNSSLFQQDDEIEVDIDSVDTETLWELDRFVTNYKKSLSKNKRKAELAIQAREQALQNSQDKTLAQIAAEAPKENKTDENIVSSSSPVQEDNQGDNRSRSSSSSSSSSSGSSSSDSDSDSSSASGSDRGSP